MACSLACSLPAGLAQALPAAPEVTPRWIDQQVAREWQRRGIQPAAPVDDAGFLRRVTLDLTGVIPSAEAVRLFLADPAPDRRARLVDSLLQAPRCADHFTDYWEQVLFGRPARRPDVDREAFRAWLRPRLLRDQPWDALVRELVTATGLNTARGGAPGQVPAASLPPVNGAVNLLLAHEGDPQDLGGVLARELLGVQVQCAQCHDHPTEPWKQADFRRFVAAFARVRVQRIDEGKVPAPRRMVIEDALRPMVGGPKGAERAEIAAAHPTALDGTDLLPTPVTNPRLAVAQWMTSPKNPWFARELVNRMWAYLLGRGFFEPIDDMRPSNPTTLPPLLDALAQDFVGHGFDVRRLLRTLMLTRLYQLSAGPSGERSPDLPLWSRYRLRPLGPVELFDSIAAATGFEQVLAVAAPGDRLERIRAQLRQSVAFTFDVDEEVAAPDFTGTVQQALMLMNGSLINSSASAVPGGVVLALAQAPLDDSERVEQLFLRTLSRRPTSAERERFVGFLAAPRELTQDSRDPRAPRPARLAPWLVLPPPRRPVAVDPLRGVAGKLRPQQPTAAQQALEDLTWALLNSSEFVFRH